MEIESQSTNFGGQKIGSSISDLKDDKVQEFKMKIARGQYKVDSEKLVNSIIKEVLKSLFSTKTN